MLVQDIFVPFFEIFLQEVFEARGFKKATCLKLMSVMYISWHQTLKSKIDADSEYVVRFFVFMKIGF